MLCKQLEHIAVMHGVDRQRSGELPAVAVRKLNGEQVKLFPDGTIAPAMPSYQETTTERGTTVTIGARTEAEARRMISGVARKFPSVDPSAAMANLKVVTRANEDILQMNLQVGGPHSSRSIVKAALAMAHDAGIPHRECTAVVSYLRGEDVEPPFGIFCERDLVHLRPTEHLIHCAAVMADPGRRLALAYVEYFGVARYVVLLTSNYAGPALNAVYAIDPRSGEELPIGVDLDLSDAEIERAASGFGFTTQTYGSAVESIMPILLKLSEDRGRKSIVASAFDRAAKDLGIKDGDVLDETRVRELSLRIAQQLTPYVLAMRRRSAGIGPGSDAEAAEQGRQ